MNTEEVVKAVSATCGVTQVVSRDVVKSFLEVVGGALSEGQEVTLAGFGRLYVKVSAPRIGRNPQTKEPVPIPARPIVKFKPTATFDAVLRASQSPRRLP